jgi:outer membrane receptor for ferrienterochelin and colicin
MYFKIQLLVLFLVMSSFASGQSAFNVVVRDSATKDLLPGVLAVIKSTSQSASSDFNGAIVIDKVPEGNQEITFSLLGYVSVTKTISFPQTGRMEILLSEGSAELDDIIVEGTRSNKSIANIPTRVEVLTEEIDEASTMDPSKIAHLITHSTGIQVQQTSATSNTANVRIQGLDGRYTQILKDGFPLYGGFSGSLSIMQIPPLDLRQVEYIKGGASTLYGGGAISGLINLLTKEPDKEETLLHLNASQIGAFDMNAFVSRRKGKVGFTLLGQRNTHKYFDADKDGYTDMPELTKYNLNPKVFFYFNNRTKLNVGATFTEEVREGGDVSLMEGKSSDSLNFYKEQNDVSRVTTQVKLEHKINDRSTVDVRNSFNIFRRSIFITPSSDIDQTKFSGNQLSSFSEVAYTYKNAKNVLITGLNFYSDDFSENDLGNLLQRTEAYQTVGGFINYNFDPGKMIAFEAGFRGDYVIDDKFFALPRIAVLLRWTPKITTRIGGGFGYRNASIFNQEAELRGYEGVVSINRNETEAEQSVGGNVDFAYKTAIGENFFIAFNQMFFYTRLDNPIVFDAIDSSGNSWHYINADGYTQSYGAETFFKFGFYDFVFFAGYTYTHATNIFNGKEVDLTLTPRHSLKGDLLYSIPGKWRVGLDYEFKSGQRLSNGRTTNEFWTYGALVEYTHKMVTYFGNVENYTNVRQTKFESLVSGPNNTPQFTEVWAPLDGIVFNAGIKIRL